MKEYKPSRSIYGLGVTWFMIDDMSREDIFGKYCITNIDLTGQEVSILTAATLIQVLWELWEDATMT